MNYENTLPATFRERPNRFIAYAAVNGRQITCHVKNTGRCRELLIPGCKIILQHHPNALAQGRKTEYSLLQVYKKTDHEELINMDSQAPNHVAYEWFMKQPGIANVRREVKFENSRFDLSFEINGKPAFAEVKGVTLEEQGIARFPDAPTKRGVKHLRELIQAAKEGFEAYIFFAITMKGIRRFEPNAVMHPEFAEALRDAHKAGVHILAYDCIVKPDSLVIDCPIPVRLL